jgi:hypothetical protein
LHSGGESKLGPLGTSATYWPILPTPGDCKDGEFCGMNGRGNRGTRRKPAPTPLCPPQIPLDQTRDWTRAAVVGSQRLTTSAMARPEFAELQPHGICWLKQVACVQSVCIPLIRTYNFRCKIVRFDWKASKNLRLFVSNHLWCARCKILSGRLRYVQGLNPIRNIWRQHKQYNLQAVDCYWWSSLWITVQSCSDFFSLLLKGYTAHSSIKNQSWNIKLEKLLYNESIIQHKAQGFQWNYTQATLHPLVAYYSQNDTEHSNSFVVVSDCLNNTVTVYLFHMVHSFLKNEISDNDLLFF